MFNRPLCASLEETCVDDDIIAFAIALLDIPTSLKQSKRFSKNKRQGYIWHNLHLQSIKKQRYESKFPNV